MTTKVRTSLSKLSASDVDSYAREGTPFDAGNMTGVVGTSGTGQLAGEWGRRYHQGRPGIIYTVRSYATPIVWLGPQGWVVVGGG